MLKKPIPKSREVVDVPADDPVGTMKRFTAGLRRVLAHPSRAAIQIQGSVLSRVQNHGLHMIVHC